MNTDRAPAELVRLQRIEAAARVLVRAERRARLEAGVGRRTAGVPAALAALEEALDART